MYDPFGGKPLSKLGSDDLQGLVDREVKEGWFVEYKRDWPGAAKVSRAIAALANSKGGWLFLGIEADPDTNAAVGLPGIEPRAGENLSDTIRHVARDCISPFPLWHEALIDVSGGRVVVALQVPEGDDTPYVHNDGRIYIRQGVGSDPVPASDRYTFDGLYRRREKALDRFRRFATSPWALSPGETRGGWAELYIVPAQPSAEPPEFMWEARRNPETELRWWSAPESHHGKLGDFEVQAPFTQVTLRNLGYCISLADSVSDLRWTPLAIETRYYGAIRAFIPFTSLDDEQADVQQMVAEYPASIDLSFFDAGDLVRVFFLCAAKAASFASKCGRPGPLRTKIRLQHCRGKVPVISGPNYHSVVRKTHCPVSRWHALEWPGELDPVPYGELEADEPMVYAGRVCRQLLMALGLPDDTDLLMEALQGRPGLSST